MRGRPHRRIDRVEGIANQVERTTTFVASIRGTEREAASAMADPKDFLTPGRSSC
jgi:hypothetical protein